MANQFGIRRGSTGGDCISITNGGTDVLINVLTLACAARAKTESEKRLAVWIAEHDQTIGRGIVGFDLDAMPWDPETFESDRRFMVDVIDTASLKTGWELLCYSPNEDYVTVWLRWFKRGFLRLKASDIRPAILPEWLEGQEEDDPAQCGFPRCEKHGIYLTYLGCQVCNS